MLGGFYESSSEKCGWLLAWSKSSQIPCAPKFTACFIKAGPSPLPPSLTSINGAGGGALLGLSGEESRGKSTEEEEECLNEREERDKTWKTN